MAVAVTVRMDLAVPLAGTFTLVGFKDAVSVGPVKNIDKDTVPENPLTLITLTVELTDPPCSRDIAEGLIVRRNEGPALPPFTYELSIVPPATVPTAAVRTIRRAFRWTRLLNSIVLQSPNPKDYCVIWRLTGRVTRSGY